MNNREQGGPTGFDNTAIGRRALVNNTIGALNTAGGARALENNDTGISNTAFGETALQANTTGSNNTAVGIDSLFSNTIGSRNTAIGQAAGGLAGDLFNSTSIGFGAHVDASNKIRLGDNFVTVVEGPPYNVVSDKAKKENFQPVDREEVLKKIGGLSLTSWNYIGHDPNQFRHYGPMGQDFFAAFGHDGIGTIGTPTTIAYTDMHGVLMIGVQALEKRTAELREEKERLQETVEAMKTENADLKSRLDRLERAIESYANFTKTK